MPLSPELEVLNVAIKTEEDGREFFLKAAERCSVKLAKDTFKSLADQELMHIKMIKDFYKALEEGTSLKDVDQLVKVQDDQRSELVTIFTSSLKTVKDTVKPSTDDFEVYKQAAKLEVDAMDYYSKHMNETKDETAKKFFGFLHDMEQEHFHMLDNSLQYLQNPADWFNLQEGWHVQG